MGKKRIDYIVKYAQRHRGPPPRRRTDFSNFLCSSPPFLSYSQSSPDSVLEISSYAKDGLLRSRRLFSSPVTYDSVLEISSYAKDGLLRSRRLFPCNDLEHMGCDVSDTPSQEIEPRVSQDVQADLYLDRDAERSQENDISMKSGEVASECMSLKATVANMNDSHDSRGQVVKSSDRENVSDQQLMPSDRWNSSNSSEVDDESSERGRGKRMRKKPRIYLDEEEQWSIAVKAASSSSRKVVRRIRIMRYLGLMAPVGSPF